MNLQLSNLLLNRIRAVYEQLQLPLPAALRRLRATGWTPFSDALAFLRDAGGEPLAPAVRSFVGARVIDDWYQQAGGYAVCQQAMDVLRLHVQQGSFGQSVRGEGAGRFELLDLDEAHGIGHVQSSTPFCREWERGLIQGSLDAPGDLLYSDVRWIEAQQRFELRFVSDANRERVAWALGEPEDAAWIVRLERGLLEDRAAIRGLFSEVPFAGQVRFVRAVRHRYRFDPSGQTTWVRDEREPFGPTLSRR